jgi:hypothetical protein
MKIALIVIFTLALGCARRANSETAEEMVSSCKAISTSTVNNGHVILHQDFASGVCWGAFGSIQAVITFVDPNTVKPLFYACVPPGSTRTQLIQVFLVYAQAHPEEYQKDYMIVVLTSLQKAFPCPSS